MSDRLMQPCKKLMTEAGIFSKSDYFQYVREMHPDKLASLNTVERQRVYAKYNNIPFHLVNECYNNKPRFFGDRSINTTQKEPRIPYWQSGMPGESARMSNFENKSYSQSSSSSFTSRKRPEPDESNVRNIRDAYAFLHSHATQDIQRAIITTVLEKFAASGWTSAVTDLIEVCEEEQHTLYDFYARPVITCLRTCLAHVLGCIRELDSMRSDTYIPPGLRTQEEQDNLHRGIYRETGDRDLDSVLVRIKYYSYFWDDILRRVSTLHANLLPSVHVMLPQLHRIIALQDPKTVSGWLDVMTRILNVYRKASVLFEDRAMKLTLDQVESQWALASDGSNLFLQPATLLAHNLKNVRRDFRDKELKQSETMSLSIGTLQNKTKKY